VEAADPGYPVIRTRIPSTMCGKRRSCGGLLQDFTLQPDKLLPSLPLIPPLLVKPRPVSIEIARNTRTASALFATRLSKPSQMPQEARGCCNGMMWLLTLEGVMADHFRDLLLGKAPSRIHPQGFVSGNVVAPRKSLK